MEGIPYSGGFPKEKKKGGGAFARFALYVITDTFCTLGPGVSVPLGKERRGCMCVCVCVSWVLG